ncbi:hypothetical protein H5410_001819 [Solanum commersonii]|uniref:Uncharacterized protein n=1 Tax=Solanum commersonii TaxID=4109 RepID=A0A9J6B039_SOLCO|nr:hypothetical protein H5410_001819 [Solanum commersonii]
MALYDPATASTGRMEQSKCKACEALQAPTWLRNRVHRNAHWTPGHQPSKSSKSNSSQLVTTHPSHKQNQASKYKKREAQIMSSENTKRDFHFTRLSKDPKLSTC